MAGRLYIGTCSWTEPRLLQAGTFYPRWARSAGDRLRFYASVFPTVEVDATYYSLPRREQAGLWVERTPEGFRFHIKAFRLFTLHWAEPSALPEDLRSLAPAGKERLYWRDLPEEARQELLRRFVDALFPLDSAGKLGVVLLQFPPWAGPRREVWEHLEAMQGALAQFRLAVEFRNRAWLEPAERRERVLRALRALGLVFVAVDEPQGFPSSVPPVAEVTADLAYVRFHGRNRQAWERPSATSAERFDWYYSDEELTEWVPRIRSMQERAGEVHILFNTNNWDQGPYNAIRMGRLLGEGLGDPACVEEVERRMGPRPPGPAPGPPGQAGLL